MAAFIAWGCEETAYHFKPEFQLPANFAKLGPYEKADVVTELTRRATPMAEFKNAALAYGLLGAAVAGALGLAGGVLRRVPQAARVAALFGVVAGALIGVGMSWVMTRIFFANIEPDSGMMLALLTHGGIWVPIGAVAGLAFGIGIGGNRSMVLALFGGLAGALVGTMLFEVANAIMFPLVRVFEPVPAGRSSRLLAFLCIGLFVALGTFIGVQESRHKKAASELT